MIQDSVPLRSRIDSTPLEGMSGRPRLQMANIKGMIMLFLIFLMIVSEIFTTSVIGSFGKKALAGRNPTAWGTVLQGIFLVIFFILSMWLINQGVI